MARSKGGDISEYLDDLTLAGFISRDFTWNLKTKDISKLSHYRLKDNFTRFYLKYVLPQKQRIEKGYFIENALSNLPGWDTIMGLQFENLVLNHQLGVMKALKLPIEEVVFANPYFQRQSKQYPGCQIDLLIQTRYNTVYVCEVRFSRHPIKPKIIATMTEKIKSLSLPKNYSYRPVLIHVNGVTDELAEQQYFSNIIDFGELLLF